MKTKAIQLIVALVVFASCGPKPGKSFATITNETNVYVSKVNANTGLKQEVIEGALTDIDGFKDIGNFKYTIYFDEQTKALYKIKNVETTAQVLTEVYYFKDGDVVLIEVSSEGSVTTFYVNKNKVVSETKSNAPKVLLEKADRFKKAFHRAH